MEILAATCLFQMLNYPNQSSKSRHIFLNNARDTLLFTLGKTKVEH